MGCLLHEKAQIFDGLPYHKISDVVMPLKNLPPYFPKDASPGRGKIPSDCADSGQARYARVAGEVEGWSPVGSVISDGPYGVLPDDIIRFERKDRTWGFKKKKKKKRRKRSLN